VLGEEHPATRNSMNDLALLYDRRGKYAEAEKLLTKLVEMKNRILGENDPSTLSTMYDLAISFTSTNATMRRPSHC
jgi:hypothetical protein